MLYTQEFLISQLEVMLAQIMCFFFFSSRRRHTRFDCDWSSDVCSSDLHRLKLKHRLQRALRDLRLIRRIARQKLPALHQRINNQDRKSTRLNSSHSQISYAVFCLKKKNSRIKSRKRGKSKRLGTRIFTD